MLFTSYTFAVFLAVMVLLYYTAARRFQWQLLLIGSFVFYGFSGWPNLIYISVTIASTYAASRRMSALSQKQAVWLKEDGISREEIKSRKTFMTRKRRRVLTACLVFNFGVLAVVKYADFVISNVNSIARLSGSGGLPLLGLVLPLGISFYTFQTMGYIIDVYRGKEAEPNPFKLALFTTFFPQLIQGPISRYEDLKLTLYSKRSFDSQTFWDGVRRLLWGLFKKLVIADRLMPAYKALTADAATYHGVYVLFGIILYAVTLFADFTGGIDMALGAAGLFGINIKENFNAPFYSKSTAEYWRRWHITMGSWFRDYLFYPLSTSALFQRFLKRSRKVWGEGFGRRAPVYAATIILWFMTGLWHGANWNFVVWGLLNGAVIIVSQELSPLYKRFHKRVGWKDKRLYGAFEIIRTFILMCFIRAFDIYDGVAGTFKALASVFTRFDPVYFLKNGVLGLGIDAADYGIVILGVAIMIMSGVIRRRELCAPRRKTAFRPVLIICLLLAILVFGAYGQGYDAAQFIYNRF